MNRRDLIAAMAASLLLPRAATAGQEAWKTDPKVAQNAAPIEAWLKDKTVNSAATKEAIAAQFRNFGANDVDNALRLLLFEKKIYRSGTGARESPYVYYGTRGSTG